MDASWPQMGAAGPVRAMTPPSAPAYRGDSAGPFNPSELEAPVAHRAPARGRGPAVPLDKQQQQSGFELAAFARSLPSRYKLAQTKTVEIRVPRPAVDAITGATPAVKAFALRLKSGDGRVTVEPEGPELVWLGAAAEPTLDEALIWRWRITPRARGRAKLRVQASLKSIAANGQIVDLAIPDHVAQVRITPNRAAGFARIGGWIVAMIVGGILVRFGEGPILTVVAAARRAIGV